MYPYAVSWPIKSNFIQISPFAKLYRREESQATQAGASVLVQYNTECPSKTLSLQFSLWWRLGRNDYITDWSPAGNIRIELMLSNSKVVKLVVQVGVGRAC